MTNDDRVRRRTMLRVAGATVSVGALAGCLEESSVDDGSVGNGDDDSSDDDSSEPSGSEPDDSNENDDDRETAGQIDTRFVLFGDTRGWEGEAPSDIEGVRNPPLELEAGNTYEIGWENGDGLGHNIELRDEDDAVVEGLETDVVQDPDGGQFLEFEASAELAYYVCGPHNNSMRGELRIGGTDSRDESDRDADDDSRTGFGIDPDERILFEGLTTGFEAVEPESIEGEVNPTLNLQEGETYEIGWIQGDGGSHNLVILDEDERLVEDYYTGDSEYDTTDDPGDSDVVEFEASEDTVYYRCHPHFNMQGEIRVE